jgi:hypothetical protein
MVDLISRSSGRGFELVFDKSRTEMELTDLADGAQIVIQNASVEAVVKTTNEVKQRIRSYINAHFKGSQFTSNNNRRVANASAQSQFYDDRAEKGQYTGLVYSKFGKRDGASGFVDFLLLHIRGGAVKARDGGWMRINASGKKTFGTSGQTGYYNLSDSNIFFSNSSDGKKLFLLRRYKKGSFSGKGGKTELLATLMRQIIFPARLTGIDEIARSRGDLFTGYFRDAFDRQAGLV